MSSRPTKGGSGASSATLAPDPPAAGYPRRGKPHHAAGAAIGRGRLPSVAASVASQPEAARLVLMGSDAAAAAFALGVGVQFVAGAQLRPIALLGIPVVVLVARVFGLYSGAARGLGCSTLADLPRQVHLATLMALLASLIGSRLLDEPWTTRTTLAFWASLLVGLPVGRCVARRLLAAVVPERCLVIGDLGRLSRVRRTLESVSAGRSTVVAGVATEQVLRDSGCSETLRELLAHHAAEHVVLAPTAVDSQEVLDLVRCLEELDVRVTVMPRFLELAVTTLTSDVVGAAAGLDVRRLGLSRSERSFKRVMDVVGATLLLVALAPVLLGITVAVRRSGAGPVLFRQRRIGRNGRPFSMIKFRTMVVDADARKDELRALNEAEGLFKITDDPRVTPVGRFLRRTSLDELPQLINVLRGEMSLIGPRPLVPEEDGTIAGWHRRRLHMRPGMTGVWQVMGSSRVPLREMVELDNLYLLSWSPWLDVKILVRTASFVARRRGI